MNANTLVRRPFKYRYFNATVYLIAANVLIFALQYVWPLITYVLALSPVAVISGWVWQVFTYMFAHANLTHLIVNIAWAFFLWKTSGTEPWEL